MKKTLCLLALIAQISYAAPEIKGDPEELKSFLHPNETLISISANADETAYSDEAIVNLIVTTERDTLSEAMKRNSNLRVNVRDALNAKGIKNEKINNSKFSSSPQYGWFGKTPDSYKIVNRIAIAITDESHLQDIAELADKHEEIELSGVSFEHSKQDEFSFKVKEQALEKIMKKKSYYEKTLGIQLTPVKFHENQTGFQPTDGAGMLEEVVVSAMRAEGASYLSKRGAQRAPKQNSFDEVKYYAQITVEFKVDKLK